MPPESQFDIFTTTHGVRPIEYLHRFTESAVNLMQNWGFDGLDIDWEYPTGRPDALVSLVSHTRAELDRYEEKHGDGYHFLLTVAASARASMYAGMEWGMADEALDAWFIMSYDYSGAWVDKSAHHANLHGEPGDGVEASTVDSVFGYIKNVPFPNKVILGMPIYGKSFTQVDATFGSEYDRPAGVDNILYKDITPNATGWSCGTDYDLVAAWCHDGERLISYDNIETVQLKVKWAMDTKLGGSMFWQSVGDKQGQDSLIEASCEQLTNFDQSHNNINYPRSEFAAIAGNQA